MDLNYLKCEKDKERQKKLGKREICLDKTYLQR